VAAIDLQKQSTGTSIDESLQAYQVIGGTFGEGQTPFLNYDASLDTVLGTVPEAATPELILDAPLFYREGWPDPDARQIVVSGTKIDSLGEVPFPAGTDAVVFDRQEVINILETDGYYTTPEGQNVLVLEIMLSDRLTGEIVKQGHLVEIDDNVPLGNEYSAYSNAKYAGRIDPDSLAPVTLADSATTAAGADVTIDVLANDSDPNGDLLKLDGIVQPRHGEIFVDGNTVTYRPDLDFVGQDGFEYWATDGHGKFTKGYVSLEVTPTSGSAELATALEEDTSSSATGFFDEILDLRVTGGETLLGVDNETLELGEGDRITIEGSDAKVGFDGEENGVSLFRMETGSELRMVADEGGFSPIQEFDSQAIDGDTSMVLSAFDMGEGTLLIDISAIAGGQAREDVLVDTDEVFGMFDDVEFVGLGDNQDATLTVDYENDRVTVSLSEANSGGTGQVDIVATGAMVTGMEDDEIWNTLTEGQNTYLEDNADIPDPGASKTPEDDELEAEAA
jgi:hypothetical protein